MGVAEDPATRYQRASAVTRLGSISTSPARLASILGDVAVRRRISAVVRAAVSAATPTVAVIACAPLASAFAPAESADADNQPAYLPDMPYRLACRFEAIQFY